VLNDTATTLISAAADLLDGAYRYGLDQPDLPDRTLFALHETTEIQTEIMRLAGLYSTHAEPATDPAAAITQAADHLYDAVPNLPAAQRLRLAAFEMRLRRLAEQVQS